MKKERVAAVMNKKPREERKEIFEETRRIYGRDRRLADSISFSKDHQSVITEDMEAAPPVGRYDAPAKVLVSQRRCLEAAAGYPGMKVCVLNFASASNPGGGVANGANAQEESICRCSTLYACISDETAVSRFHNAHREALKAGRMNALYNNDCIYTPKVTVFRDDNTEKVLEETFWYEIDVISCAAPNLRNIPGNAMNPDSGRKAVVIQPADLLELHKKRISRVLDIAAAKGADVMVLGAFGCGAFRNPPAIVAEAVSEVLGVYLRCFRVIEFAVYCQPADTRNYDVFQRVLSPVCS